MNVAISFPLWTDNWTPGNANKGPANDGSEVTNVIKITVSSSSDPLDDYYGFWVPRGQPFMKSNNEIEVVTTRVGV